MVPRVIKLIYSIRSPSWNAFMLLCYFQLKLDPVSLGYISKCYAAKKIRNYSYENINLPSILVIKHFRKYQQF